MAGSDRSEPEPFLNSSGHKRPLVARSYHRSTHSHWRQCSGRPGHSGCEAPNTRHDRPLCFGARSTRISDVGGTLPLPFSVRVELSVASHSKGAWHSGLGSFWLVKFAHWRSTSQFGAHPHRSDSTARCWTSGDALYWMAHCSCSCFQAPIRAWFNGPMGQRGG